jgi:hypothetical protein
VDLNATYHGRDASQPCACRLLFNQIIGTLFATDFFMQVGDHPTPLDR